MDHRFRIPFNSRGSLHGVFSLVFLVFCFHQQTHKWNYKVINRVGLHSTPRNLGIKTPPDCTGLNQHEGYESVCEFLLANPQCKSDGFFNYMNFFYCSCQNHAFFGYIVLVLWLAALFYLLGNTAADYFCCSLEKLSNLLRLPPTVAGVTLLPLGNGAPDVFASIAAFVGTDNGDVGLNSILGGAIFVTCVVVGTISICVADQAVNIDKKCFIRDVSVFLFAVVSLAFILLIGEVSVGGAIAFVFIYIVYAALVAANEFLRLRDGILNIETISVPLLAVTQMDDYENKDLESINMSFTDSDDVPLLIESKVPHWMWGSNVSIYSEVLGHMEDNPKPLWGWKDEGDPVDGMDTGKQTPPKVLTYVSHSFNLEMPVMVIGSGLGEVRKNLLFPACAPKGVNHENFYSECCKPACYFVAKDYGHLDMLDDETKGIRGKTTHCLCKNGKSREPMRRFVGGVVVAFLKAYFGGDFSYLTGINDDGNAPVLLQKVDFML